LKDQRQVPSPWSGLKARSYFTDDETVVVYGLHLTMLPKFQTIRASTSNESNVDYKLPYNVNCNANDNDCDFDKIPYSRLVRCLLRMVFENRNDLESSNNPYLHYRPYTASKAYHSHIELSGFLCEIMWINRESHVSVRNTRVLTVFTLKPHNTHIWRITTTCVWRNSHETNTKSHVTMHHSNANHWVYLWVSEIHECVTEFLCLPQVFMWNLHRTTCGW